MSRTVMCRKYQQELKGLDAPPYPGPRGEEIYEKVSKKAWGEWLKLQTMLINEKRLNVRLPEARTYLNEQMEKFLRNDETEEIEGFVPPA